MSAVWEIEQAVSQLPPQELARFREWFEKFDAEIWDKQFEEGEVRETRQITSARQSSVQTLRSQCQIG